jgi:hypothetical protein
LFHPVDSTGLLWDLASRVMAAFSIPEGDTLLARLTALCVVELTVIAWLLVQVLAAPLPTGLPAPATSHASISDSSPTPIVGDGQRPAQVPRSNQLRKRQVVSAPWQPDDPVGILLSGVVRWSDGVRVVEPSVSARQGKVYANGDSSEDGSYALVGLSPGEWQVTLRSEGGVTTKRTLVVTNDAQQTQDYVVERTFPVQVRIITADGKDGRAAVTTGVGLGFSQFHLIAQKEVFQNKLAPTDGSFVRAGTASWRGERVSKDGIAGTLHLAGAPPANVALMLRHMVVAQQLVVPGQTDMTFVVDPAELSALAGSAAVRVVNADTGQPIDGARVSLRRSNGGFGGGQTDKDGRAVIENLVPGLLRCEISAKECEGMYTTVQIHVGQRLELGEVRLGPRVKFTGTVVDEAGKPVGGVNITWAELKWLGTAMPFATNRRSRSEVDGAFQLWSVGRGTIAVTARDGSGRITHGVFENPPSEAVVLQLAESMTCKVTWPKDPTRRFTVMLFDKQHRPLHAACFGSRDGRGEMTMARGSYAFEVRDGSGRSLQSGTLTFGDVPSTLVIE